MINTKRLVLRPAGEDDLAWIMGLERDPANVDKVWQGSLEDHRAEVQDPDYWLLVHEDLKGRAVGYSLSYHDRAQDSFELRRIVSSVQGLGYGREAILALMGLAFEELGAHRFWLDVYPHNTHAQALYQDLGMSLDGRLRGSYKAPDGYWDQEIYSLLDNEWEEMIKDEDA